jgi:hypothetical protein
LKLKNYLPVEEGLVWGSPMLVVLVFAAAADAGLEVIEDGVADGGLEELLTGTGSEDTGLRAEGVVHTSV